MRSCAADFRKRAWEVLRGNYPLALGAAVIASLLGGASEGGGGSFNINVNDLNTGGEPMTPEALGAYILELLPVLLVTFFVTMAVSLAFRLFVGNVIAVGYARFNLALVDRKGPSISHLFAYFRTWTNVVLTQLLRAVIVFLWSLLFLIPGIIASYSYAMVPYILADDPTLSPREALARSKEMMRGNRFRFFCLQLSFIGWYLLCGLTCCFAGIASLCLLPYPSAAYADFYREISDTRPLPDEPGDGRDTVEFVGGEGDGQ